MRVTDKVILFFLVLLNVLVRLPQIGCSSFDLDEAVHIWFAQKSLPEIIGRAAEDPNPPLYNILISFWIKLFGVSEIAVRWFSLLFSAFAGGALFFFLRRNVNLRVALFASVLFLLSAIQLKFAHNARPYTLMVFLMICSYGMLLDTLRRPSGAKAALYGLFTALMIYAHPTAIFNLPAQGLFILLHFHKDLLAAVEAMAGIIGAFVIYIIWYVSIPYFKGEIVTWLPPPGLDELMLAIRHLNGSQDNRLFVLQVLVAAAGGIAVVSGLRAKRGTMYLGVLWTVIPVAANFLFSQVADPIFQAKYVLSAQVGMTVLLAISLDAIRWEWLRWPMIVLLLLASVEKLNWQVTSGEDWRTAASIVRNDEGVRTATFISPWYEMYAFAYHYDRELYKDHVNTQPLLVRNRVFTAWHDIIETGSEHPRYFRVHFIEAQPSEAKQFGRIDSLKAYAKLVAEHHLEGMNLYTFELKMPPPVLDLDLGDGELLDESREYSSMVLFPVDGSFSEPTVLEVTAHVRSKDDISEVFLVASFINDGEYLLHEQVGNSKDAPDAEGWHRLIIRMTYDPDTHGTSDLKTFVWNPSKVPVSVRDLKVEVVTP